MTAQQGDRRRAVRFNLGAPVTCVIAEREFSFQAQTLDVSLSGVLLDGGAEKPAVGTEVMLWFSFFPGSSGIPVRGRVVRQTATGFAVQFIELASPELAMLRLALPTGPP